MSLGLVASGKRNIKSGDSYERFFDRGLSTGKEQHLRTGDTFDTIVEMKAIIAETLHQTKKIAPELKGATRLETCKNIWEFVYNHYQYTPDADSKEQLRTPLRSWIDRRAGIDCDCMSITMSSILTNLGIPHILRKAKYNGKSYFQHIYVIVPKVGSSISSKGSYYTLDAVVDKFNYEVPTTATHDLMMPITRLDGIGAIGFAPSLMGLEGIIEGSLIGCNCFGQEFEGMGAVPGIQYTPELVEAEFLIRTKKHLENTLAAAKDLGGKSNELLRKRLVYALSNWHNRETRERILNELAAIEEQEQAMNGLAGLDGLWSSIKKAASKVSGAVSNTVKKASVAVNKVVTKAATAVKNTAQATYQAAKIGVQKVGAGIKQAANWVADKAKDVAEFVIRFNPLTILIRNGLLLAMKLNLFRMSERLGYALWTEQQAQVKGLDVAQWKKLKGRYDKALKIFTKLQGKKENFDEALRDGWDKGTKKHDLLRGLGEPVTAATGTAAASGVIATIVAWIKDVDFGALFKKIAGKKPDYSADDKEASLQPVPAGQTPLPSDLFEAPSDYNPAATFYPTAQQQAAGSSLWSQATQAASSILRPTSSPATPTYVPAGGQYMPQQQHLQQQAAPAAAGSNNTVLILGGAAALVVGAMILTRK